MAIKSATANLPDIEVYEDLWSEAARYEWKKSPRSRPIVNLIYGIFSWIIDDYSRKN